MPDMKTALTDALHKGRVTPTSPPPEPVLTPTNPPAPGESRQPAKFGGGSKPGAISQKEILWTWLQKHPGATTQRAQDVLQWGNNVVDTTMRELFLRKMVRREKQGAQFLYWALGHTYRLRSKVAGSVLEMDKKQATKPAPKPPTVQTLPPAVALPDKPKPSTPAPQPKPDAGVGFDPAAFVQDLTFGQVKALFSHLQEVLK